MVCRLVHVEVFSWFVFFFKLSRDITHYCHLFVCMAARLNRWWCGMACCFRGLIRLSRSQKRMKKCWVFCFILVFIVFSIFVWLLNLLYVGKLSASQVDIRLNWWRRRLGRAMTCRLSVSKVTLREAPVLVNASVARTQACLPPLKPNIKLHLFQRPQVFFLSYFSFISLKYLY